MALTGCSVWAYPLLASLFALPKYAMPESAIGQSSAILNSNFIALVEVKDRHIVWANAAMHRIFGYEPDELIGKPTRLLFPDQTSYEAFGSELYEAIEEKGTYTNTVRQVRKDGSTGWYEFNISRLDVHPDAVVGAIVDRTERHNLLIQLKASEERYRTLVEMSSVVTWHCPPSGLHVAPQPSWIAFTGQTAEEMLGAGWAKAVHPEDVATAAALWNTAVERDEPFFNEHRIRRHDGEWRWMRVRAVPVRNHQGQTEEWMGMGQDISEQKQAELALKENEQRLEMAVAGSGLALWDWDLTTGNIHFSKRWYEILGYPAEASSTHVDHWKRLFNPDDLIRVEGLVAAYLAGETPILHSEHRVRHKESYWITVEATGKITQRDATGCPLRIVGTVLDVSNRKRLNEEGIDLLKQIETLIRESTSNPPAQPANSAALEGLTKRERQILGMIAEGMTSAQIARQLQISANTIISHRKNLMAKLDLHTTVEVTRFAMDHGLLKPKR